MAIKNTLRTITGAVFFYTSIISPALSRSGERDFFQYVETERDFSQYVETERGFSQYLKTLILNEKTNSLGELIKNNPNPPLHGRIFDEICNLRTEWKRYIEKYKIDMSVEVPDLISRAIMDQISSGTIQKESFIRGLKHVRKIKIMDCIDGSI
jgi:hypothetical protein|tara:strand:- start:108 stop:569 length:462 start_codon:yes stop_codon:yes gene_type:complete